MQVLRTFEEVRAWSGGAPFGLVPTMGALHAGHLAHVAVLREHAAAGGRVAVSVFVNPTQFGPGEDLERYPRDLEADVAACAAAGAAAIFAPAVEAVYPPAVAATPLHVEVPALSGILEGAARPGHFAGVCRVVLKLLAGLQPAVASFGEKDWQQWCVIRAMVADACLPVELVGVPTVREPDGLAMSSRNRYLDARQREVALSLHRALRAAAHGEEAMRAVLTDGGVDAVDYAVVRDAATLGSVRAGQPARALVAARVGGVRLIDNMAVGVRP